MQCTHPLSSGTGNTIPRISCPKRSAAWLCLSPKAPRLTLTGIQFIRKKKKSPPFWVFAFVNLLPTWSHERRRRMLNRSSSRVFTAKSSTRKTSGSNQLNPLVFQPRWPHELTILEAGDLQLGLQLPQNNRPIVCFPPTYLFLAISHGVTPLRWQKE